MHTADWGLAEAPAVLSLMDGGVYDNLGLEWFQGWESTRRPPGGACRGVASRSDAAPLRSYEREWLRRRDCQISSAL